MPEGDTIHRAAAMLRPALTNTTVENIAGTHRDVAQHRSRLIGRRIEGVAAHGKHLLIHFERDWTLRTHMGMAGRWGLFAIGERWTTTPGKARVIIETADAVAVCFATPYVEIGPTSRVLDRLTRIGPDLVDDEAPLSVIAATATEHLGPTMADLLLDQSVASGIGNVFKSEVLFLEGISPHAPPSSLTPGAMTDVYRRASKLLRANVRPGQRSTTGSQRRSDEYWVYGRAGAPCRRCGTTIERNRHGEFDRSTYWCPSCQPLPGSPSERSASNG